MIQSLLVIPEQDDGQARSTELSAAYQQAARAYAVARREVYDLHGGRLPAPDQLTEQQQALLDDLARAEAALDRQRQREWQQADGRVAAPADHQLAD